MDSGAESTVISKDCADRCGLKHLDTIFAGKAQGVGSGNILGRYHMVEV